MVLSAAAQDHPLPESFLLGGDEALRSQLLTAASAWMGFLPGMELAEDAAQASPHQPAPAVLAGLMALLAQTPAAHAAAVTHLRRAQVRVDGLDAWGQGLLETALLWSRGDLGLALRRLEQLAAQCPEAPLTLKVAEWLCYLRGQEVHGPRLLDLARWFRHHHPDHADVLACEAFALELCGCLSQAEVMAQEAIARRDANPWADHALLHVLHRQGRLDEARDWAAQRDGSWRQAAPPMRLHNLWHRALVALEAGCTDADLLTLPSLEGGPPGAGELLDRIALAWRLELAGQDGRVDWRDLAEQLVASASLPLVPLIAAHHAWCLARAARGEDLDRLLAAIDAQAAHSETLEPDWCWRPAGVALVRGVVALARGEAALALSLLGPIRPRFAHAGGSDAQVQVLHQSLFVAASRAGDRVLARRLLEDLRADRSDPSALDRHWATSLQALPPG